jgi:hypothetical protein
MSNHEESEQMPSTIMHTNVDRVVNGLTPVPAEFTSSAPMATNPQLEWIRKCRDERVMSAEIAAFIDAKLDPAGSGITKRRASELLDKLFKLPRQPKAETVHGGSHTMPQVANGRYAVRDASDVENAIKFYRVNTPTEGRWAGRTFVDRLASDERYPVRNAAQRKAVLTTIAADPIGAAQLYGREIGHCGRCSKTLTRVVSRAFGIGPDCAEHMGISGAYEAMEASLKAQGIDPNGTVEEES